MWYHIDRQFIGDSVTITRLRDGIRSEVTLPLSHPAKRCYSVLPPPQFETRPQYIIIGGLVFSPLTTDLLASWGKSWRSRAPQQLLKYFYAPPASMTQPVVLVQILADELTVGYNRSRFQVLRAIDGVDIKDMDDLITAVENATSDHITFEFIPWGNTIVLPRADLQTHTQRILDTYHIPADRSDDLMPSGH